MSLWIFSAAWERMGLTFLSKQETSDLQGEWQLPARAITVMQVVHYIVLTNYTEEFKGSQMCKPWWEVKAGVKPSLKIFLHLPKLWVDFFVCLGIFCLVICLFGFCSFVVVRVFCLVVCGVFVCWVFFTGIKYKIWSWILLLFSPISQFLKDRI